MKCKCWIDTSRIDPDRKEILFCPLHAAAPEMLKALKAVKDRLSAWQDTANIVYQQSGSEDAYNQRGNYAGLVSLIDAAISLAERKD